jgi:hypothetical protein
MGKGHLDKTALPTSKLVCCVNGSEKRSRSGGDECRARRVSLGKDGTPTGACGESMDYTNDTNVEDLVARRISFAQTGWTPRTRQSRES